MKLRLIQVNMPEDPLLSDCFQILQKKMQMISYYKFLAEYKFMNCISFQIYFIYVHNHGVI